MTLEEAVNRGLLIASTVALGALIAYAGARALRARQKRPRPVFDYSNRSGFPKPPEQMRGIARNRGQSPVSLAISP